MDTPSGPGRHSRGSGRVILAGGSRPTTAAAGEDDASE
jgi:hypothetical protein